MSITNHGERGIPRIIEKTLSEEPRQTSVLYSILENDPIARGMFLKLFLEEERNSEPLALGRLFRVNEQQPGKAGRFDLVLTRGPSTDSDLELIIEAKRIGGFPLNSASKEQILRYLRDFAEHKKRKLGLLVSVKCRDELLGDKEIVGHSQLVSIVTWADVAKMLERRLDGTKHKLVPDEETKYWTKQLIKYITEEEELDMEQTVRISIDDAVAFSRRHIVVEKFKELLDGSVGLGKKSFPGFMQSPQNSYQDNPKRYGLFLLNSSTEVCPGLFFGFTLKYKDVNGLPQLYSFIESMPPNNRVTSDSARNFKKEIRRAAEEVLVDKMGKRFNEQGWTILSNDDANQIVTRVSSLAPVLMMEKLETQVRFVTEWFDKCASVFSDIWARCNKE